MDQHGVRGRDSDCAKGWDGGKLSQIRGRGGRADILLQDFELITFHTEVIKSLMRNNISPCHAALYAESWGPQMRWF